MEKANPPVFSPEFRAALLELFQWRGDVRHFCADPVSEETIERLIDAATLAPSVGLSEPWRFIVVEEPNRRAAVRACFERRNAKALSEQSPERARLYVRLKLAGLNEAPVHIAVFADRQTLQGHGLGRRTMPEAIEYSVAMSIHTLWLAARSEGIGVGWVSILDPEEMPRILEVPPSWTFVAYLCLGYPLEESDTPTLMRDGWETRNGERPPLRR